MYQAFVKPVFDFFAALVAIVLLSPVFIIVTVLLYFANQGKPFFVQLRPGKNERIFKIIKFKTMNDLKDAEGNLLSDEKRLTTVGKIVRKTSLDEIPQLLNILKGDMSLVGPRPLLPEYLPLYSDFERRRHAVKPGITGLPGVSGRNTLSWDERFKLDTFYVDNISFVLDMKIIFLTILKVIKREGINAEGAATMHKYTGEKKK